MENTFEFQLYELITGTEEQLEEEMLSQNPEYKEITAALNKVYDTIDKLLPSEAEELLDLQSTLLGKKETIQCNAAFLAGIRTAARLWYLLAVDPRPMLTPDWGVDISETCQAAVEMAERLLESGRKAG